MHWKLAMPSGNLPVNKMMNHDTSASISAT